MMPNLWRWCAIGLALLLAVAVAYGFVQDRRADRLDSAVAYQQSQWLEAESAAMGWETRWATEEADLLADGAEKDRMIAALRRSVRIAGAHTVARTVVAAEARVDTVLVADTVYATGAHVHHIDMPPFTGVAQCRPPDTLELALRALIPVELIGNLTADERLLVLARTSAPGVKLDVQTLVWDPPEPESGGNPWLWAGVGIAAGAVGWELIR